MKARRHAAATERRVGRFPRQSMIAVHAEQYMSDTATQKADEIPESENYSVAPSAPASNNPAGKSERFCSVESLNVHGAKQ